MPEEANKETRDFSEEGTIEDLPQEITQSYGTGVHPQPGLNEGGRSMEQDSSQYTATSPELSGGDVDAAWALSAVGEETVGGTVATPDQDIVDELGAAVGLEMPDRAFLRTTEILEQRDSQRWELDPKSSEDYEQHNL